MRHFKIDMKRFLLLGLTIFMPNASISSSAGYEKLAEGVPATNANSRQDLSVPRQPMMAQVHRLVESLEVLGTPLPEEEKQRLFSLKDVDSDDVVLKSVLEILDRRCLAVVEIPEQGKPIVVVGDAATDIAEQGWATFLVKVINRPERLGRLLIESPNAKPLPRAPAEQVEARWMQLSVFDGQPMRPDLSGLAVEYKVIQIYSRDAGEKRGVLEFAFEDEEGVAGTLIKRWRFDSDADGWQSQNEVELVADSGALIIESLGRDPFLHADVSYPNGGPMTLRFWGETDQEGAGQVFWWTKDQPQADPTRQQVFLLKPNMAQVYEVPFFVEGDLAGIRLDPLMTKGRMKIDWIDLVSNRHSENWAQLPLSFNSKPATRLHFRIRDAYGKPSFAKFVVRNSQGKVFPAQSKRLAPDFFFQSQIYRGDGESLALPAGEYWIECSRGPESIPELKQIAIGDEPVELAYQVNRWIDPSKDGWWSGDHHIHAAGCQHYENPTQGVAPGDMIRHIMGEDLKVGCCLTWGPCFDFQKRFFTGKINEQSQYPYILRYDVEVSGFGSHQSGHLNLLNLKEQIYPGGESKDHWPTLGLNTLKWAKRQGAICGPAHSSLGLERFVGRVPGTEGKDGPGGLPTYQIPAYDGIGANEFIVDVTHQVPGPDGSLVQAVDFISAMDTDRSAEWNMWYHVLNCGIRVVVSGETDFPCISGDRVGMGRVYAKVDGELTFQKWVKSLGEGRSYVSDGLAHITEFVASSSATGEVTTMGIEGSQLQLDKPGKVTLATKVAIRLEETPRIPVELIVNGFPVESQEIVADGQPVKIEFETKIDASSWAAIRVFPHAHSNPIYIEVAGQPIRASRDSARWCLLGVEQCWKMKQITYSDAEQADAKAAFDHARKFYQQILDETE